MPIVQINGETVLVSGKAIEVSGGSREDVTWHQCPEAVREYLDDVSYDPTDYTNSEIASYAPAVAVQSNTKPIGETVDGETFYNEVPNENTPFASTNKAGTIKPLDRLRWLNTPQAQNVRDLGGWSCDGGTVKYGLLFRGGEVTAADRSVLVDECGVRVELNLRGAAEAGRSYSVLGNDVRFYCPTSFVWYAISDKATWKEIIACVFENASHGVPVYFHCSAGADRTCTVACVLEGLLGVSQSDIDKDYELTCFSTGTDTDAHARRRNETDWGNLITAISSLSGATFRDKCVNFVASLGFTAAEINAFRAAMIDGNPTSVTPSISTFTVTNTLEKVTSDNAAVTAAQYQPYKAVLTPDTDCSFKTVRLSMGNVDVKPAYYTQLVYPSEAGVISIPNVSGNIVIEAVAEEHEHIVTNYAEPDSVDWLSGYRLTETSPYVEVKSAQDVTNFIPCHVGDTIRIKGLHNATVPPHISYYTADKSFIARAYGNNATVGCIGWSYDSATDIATFTICSAYPTVAYFRVDPENYVTGYNKNNIFISVNEEIPT